MDDWIDAIKSLGIENNFDYGAEPSLQQFETTQVTNFTYLIYLTGMPGNPARISIKNFGPNTIGLKIKLYILWQLL